MAVKVRTTFENVVKWLIVFLGILQLVESATWYMANDNNKYLIEIAYKYNWLQAHDECLRRDLQLVVIDNATKNEYLESLLRIALGKSRNLWIGHHDEFNTTRDTKRPFYSLATGQKISFSNWSPNNPNNHYSVEHCAHIWDGSDFQWNDSNCEDTLMGYICEKHHLTTKYHMDLDGKHQTVNQKNTQISSKWSTTQTEIKEINNNTHSENYKVLREFKNSTDEIIADLKNAIWEVLAKKPYMDAVVADLGNSISEIVSEKEDEFAKLLHELHQTIDVNHVIGESKTNSATAKFSEELTKNINDIDKLLAL